MQYTFPNYYKEFSCIAGACPDTCCAGWQIVIDDQTLKKYQHFKGPFRNRLHNDIDWKQHVFASITDAVLFSTKRTCVISTQKQDRKYSAEPAEIILDILKNLKVCVRFPCRSPVRRQQGFYFPKKKRYTLSQKKKRQKKKSMMTLIISCSLHLWTPVICL